MHKVKTSQFRDTKAVAAPYPTDASYEGKQEKIKGVVRTLQTISKPKLFLNIKIIFKLFIHLREEVGLIPISTGIFFFSFSLSPFRGKILLTKREKKKGCIFTNDDCQRKREYTYFNWVCMFMYLLEQQMKQILQINCY